EVIYIGNIEFYIEQEKIDDNEETNNEIEGTESDESIDAENEEEKEESEIINSEELAVEETKETEADQEIEIEEQKTINKEKNPWMGISADYFKVVTNNVTVYDNRDGMLKPIGSLEKGQVYPRIKDYGTDWHQIQFGNAYGYVYKSATIPDKGDILTNENSGHSPQGRTFEALEKLTVYDNTSGQLIPFGYINEGQRYPIVSDYGDWWQVILG